MINKICKILFWAVIFNIIGLGIFSGCFMIWQYDILFFIPIIFFYTLLLFCPIGIVFSIWGLFIRIKYNKGQLFYPISLLVLSILLLISVFFSYSYNIKF